MPEIDSDSFLWTPQPIAANWVRSRLDEAQTKLPFLAHLGDRMLADTGTKLIDWVEHFEMSDSDSICQELQGVGYRMEVSEHPDSQETEYIHPLGMFPRVRIRRDSKVREPAMVGVGIRVESVDDFLRAHALRPDSVIGPENSRFRFAEIENTRGCCLTAVERHGWRGLDLPNDSQGQISTALHHRDMFRQRKRQYPSIEDGFAETARLIRSAIEEMGPSWACDVFFQSEREYWQSRNRAAQIQWKRQQTLGLGWANHDHHTYRSSREAFHRLVSCLELLGFQCRERFYAGKEAGWGAQVLEQPECGIVVFADVDLSLDEIRQDIAHEPLPSNKSLGTIGLWCRLHSEAFFEAGLHHLECQFEFDRARGQLEAVGVETMAPFTDFPHLKQAFTTGESWSIDRIRILEARADGVITAAEAEKFQREGALGSHLEILERNDGYKGFNQSGISEIILRTDPRRAG